MAKQTLDLSKSIISGKPPSETGRINQVSCRYLYHGVVTFRQRRGVPLHVHPFWHIDIQISGKATLLSRNAEQTINPGAVYFIPATVQHGFSYPPRKSEFLTLKVAVLGRDGGTTALFAQPTEAVQGVRRALLDVTPRTGTPSRSQQGTIELLAAALISHCYPESAPESPPRSIPSGPSNSLVEGVKLFVSSSQGRVPSVKEVARHMGYSISHIAARFRESEGVPLKRYLDDERCRVASWLMVYSDMSVGEVAASLQFTDIYSFSRFFKRLSGSSPTEFRDKTLRSLTHDLPAPAR
jgi:AraC-like DNA-binding protein/quercetin dioxygenase-like cupin family protein